MGTLTLPTTATLVNIATCAKRSLGEHIMLAFAPMVGKYIRLVQLWSQVYKHNTMCKHTSSKSNHFNTPSDRTIRPSGSWLLFIPSAAKQLFPPVVFTSNRENGPRERQLFPRAAEKSPKIASSNLHTYEY